MKRGVLCSDFEALFRHFCRGLSCIDTNGIPTQVNPRLGIHSSRPRMELATGSESTAKTVRDASPGFSILKSFILHSHINY